MVLFGESGVSSFVRCLGLSFSATLGSFSIPSIPLILYSLLATNAFLENINALILFAALTN